MTPLRSSLLGPAALVAALAAVLSACGAPARPGPTAPSASAAVLALDEDGVAELYPTAPGSALRLGTQDFDHAAGLAVENAAVHATARAEGALRYWNLVAWPLIYDSGGAGLTTRVHLYASGGTQQHDFTTQRGFLSSPADVRDQEFTAFVRPHGIVDPARAAVTLKIRGGSHAARHPGLASCTMMTLQAASTGATVRFGKELIHPLYDHVQLTPRTEAALAEGRWVGLKLVSFAVPGDATRVVNRLYVDTEPFDSAGRPRNGWRLHGEYVDVAGVATGRYTTLVDWGGWQTTLRSDGVHDLDFLLLGAREIAPRAP